MERETIIAATTWVTRTHAGAGRGHAVEQRERRERQPTTYGCTARLLMVIVNATAAVTCTRPAAVTSTEYTITETGLTVVAFDVTLACAPGYASSGTPTAVACTSAGDYTVTDPCTGASSTAL